MAAVAVWLIATVGLVALTTAGPMFRPGFQPSSIGIAGALIIGLAVGWPLLTASGRAIALFCGQGAIVLAIDAARHERTTIDVGIALAAWIIASGVAVALRAVANRHRNSIGPVWATSLGVIAIVGVRFLG